MFPSGCSPNNPNYATTTIRGKSWGLINYWLQIFNHSTGIYIINITITSAWIPWNNLQLPTSKKQTQTIYNKLRSNCIQLIIPMINWWIVTRCSLSFPFMSPCSETSNWRRFSPFQQIHQPAPLARWFAAALGDLAVFPLVLFKEELGCLPELGQYIQMFKIK